MSLLKEWIEQRKLTDPRRSRFRLTSASSLTSAFRDARKRAGIIDLRLHDLRHDAATRFWKEYKDVALLQQFLGDRDIKSPMRYLNLDRKEARRLMRTRKSGWTTLTTDTPQRVRRDSGKHLQPTDQVWPGSAALLRA